MVCTNDGIDINVDFIPVVSTQSPDDALALLIGMYTIFELSFDKKSRAIRLLYSILHGEKRFLSNSVRQFIKEKNIDIYNEEKQKGSSSSFNHGSNITTDQSLEQSQLNLNLADKLANQNHSFPVGEARQNQTLNNAPDLNSNTTKNADQ